MWVSLFALFFLLVYYNNISMRDITLSNRQPMKNLIRYDLVKDGAVVNSFDASEITFSDVEGIAMAQDAEVKEIYASL